MTKVARLFEEEKEQAVEQSVEQAVINMIKENIDENVIIRVYPQLSLNDVRRIVQSMNIDNNKVEK